MVETLYLIGRCVLMMTIICTPIFIGVINANYKEEKT